jgi:hypothetical protein
MSGQRLTGVCVALTAVACSSNPWGVKDRAPGERTPLSATCDELDTYRCGLPWPSSTYTVVDSSTDTGLRVAFQANELPEPDDTTFLNVADGFSRVSPLMTGFSVAIDPNTLGDLTTGAVRLISSQPGETFGEVQPLRMRLVTSEAPEPTGSLVVALPRRPLAANSDFVVAVLDSLHDTSGQPPAVSRAVQVALGLVKPASLAEAKLAAYHAPTRTALAKAGLSPEHIVRVWDFTTRSLTDPALRMQQMRSLAEQAVANGTVTVALDPVTPQSDATTAAIVTGNLNGVPYFQDASGQLQLDNNGLPQVVGTHPAPFRVAIPKVSTSTYRVAMYGHGLGGSYMDSTFDDVITSLGLAKVAGNFIGWSGALPSVFSDFGALLQGTAISTAGLLQSVADLDAIEHALAGPLGDVLSAATLGDLANPSAGIRPDVRAPIWVGGSLGGTMGLTFACSDASIQYAVLNVPGAAWTHFIPLSEIMSEVITAYSPSYGGQLDFLRLFYMSQNNWDDIDGSVWADVMPVPARAFLMQESIGDPVLPNPGTEVAAAAVHASIVGPALVSIPGLNDVMSASGGCGLTQFEVSASDPPLAIHGFAAGTTTAGMAARAQINAFIESALAAAPLITVPPQCVQSGPDGSCNFSGQ